MLGLQEIYEENDLIYLILDYQKSGTLLERLGDDGKFPEEQAQNIMEQLLLALDYLHCRRVVHRDIKLDNILINKIDDGDLKVIIADFGLACLAPEELLTEKCGTPCYLAPEMLRNQGYDTKCDIFSLGSVFFNLVTGFYLFNAETPAQVI